MSFTWTYCPKIGTLCIEIGGFTRGGEYVLRLYDETGGEVSCERIEDVESDGTVYRGGIEK